MAGDFSSNGKTTRKFGYTKSTRLLTALSPDYVKLDDRKIEHLLSYISEYASQIPFYNAKNEQAGTWEAILLKDISTVLARIITTRLDTLNADFENRLRLFKATPKYIDKLVEFKALGKVLFTMVEKFDQWLIQIQNTNIPAKEIETQIEGEFINIIIEKVSPLLHRLIDYQKLAAEELNVDLDWDFSQFSKIWQINFKNRENIALFTGNDRSEKLETAALKFRLLFKELHLVLSYTTIHLKPFFDQTIQVKSNHSPEIGLYLSFLKLFCFIQDEYNDFTSRFLKTYYTEILKQEKLSAEADYVFAKIELGRTFNSLYLEEGIQFSAGFNDAGQEIVFVNDRDTYLSNVTVEDVKSIFISRKENGGKNLNYEIISNIYSSDISEVIGQPTTEETQKKQKRIPLFGEEQEYKPEEIENMNQSELGFAISSPLFYLSGGSRKITMDVDFVESSTKSYKRLFVDFLDQEKRSDSNISKSPEDIFYNIFNKNVDDGYRDFRVFFSGANKWVEIPPNRIKISVKNDAKGWNYKKGTDEERFLTALNHLQVELMVESTLPAFVNYSKKLDQKGEFAEGIPTLKFVLNAESQPFVYSFLKDVMIETIHLDVKVENITDIRGYTELGNIDTKHPFKSFGNDPLNGTSFVFSNPEVFKKPIYDLGLHIKWNSFPNTVKEFKSHFQSYNNSFDPINYNLRVNVLRDGDFMPLNYENREISTNLFGLENSFESNNDDLLEDYKANLSLDPNTSNILIEEEYTSEDYSIESMNGFMQLSLDGPNEMFGHESYQDVYANVMTMNAQSDIDNKIPLPLKPITPIIKEFSLSYHSKYKFSTTSSNNFDVEFSLYHLHPFGQDKVINDGIVKSNQLLPNYSEDGFLYIGLDNINPPQPISLWFQLTPNSHSFWNPEPPKVIWRYLASNKWFDFSEADIFFDGTDNFTKSGIVQLNLPQEINNRNTIMENGKFWIQAVATGNLELFCDAVKIMTNALELRRVVKPDSVFENLPPHTISSTIDKVAAIKSIYQPFASEKGTSKESDEQFYCRISELLNHKNYAVTHKDFERIILQKFQEIHQVKSISNLNSPNEEAKYLNILSKANKGKLTKYQESILEFWRKGVITVVIPDISNATSHSFPRFNYKFLEKVNSEMAKRISPFVKCKVINPQLEYLRVICNVKFEEGKNNGLFIQKLQEDIDRFIAPWLYDSKTSLKLGGELHQQSLFKFVKERDYVKFVTKFSILHIVEEEGRFRVGDTASIKEHFPILESMAWGVFIPDWNHEITLISREIEEEPEERLKKRMIVFQDRINILSKGRGLPIRINQRTKKAQSYESGNNYELKIKI